MAEIEWRKDMDKINFKNANNYYNEVVSVMARYNVKLNDTELIKIMANKVISVTYTTKVMDHLQSSSANNLEKLCSDINKIQCLTKKTSGGGNHRDKKEKEVQLTITDFKGTCGHYNKKEHKDCLEQKKKIADMKCTGFCKRGHLEANCWKKHPDKVLQWFKDNQPGKETSSKSVDMVLASIKPTNDGQDFGCKTAV